MIANTMQHSQSRRVRSAWACFGATLFALSIPPSAQVPERVKLELKSEDTLEVQAAWEPFQDSVYKLYKRYEQLQGFAPAVKTAKHDMQAFRAFLPPDDVAVGDTWRVDPAAALPFLRQLHSGATAELHHGFGAAPGGWACLRALSPEQAEIRLRVHAEFVLVPGDGRMETTSWLTPAQFAGTLVIDRKLGSVRSFQLALPDRNTNVDVNVPMKLKPGETALGGLADIGYIPRMEVFGGATPSGDYATDITVPEAQDRLAKRFYRFASIEWMDLPAAARAARERKRPLHVVLLFGSLDDESC